MRSICSNAHAKSRGRFNPAVKYVIFLFFSLIDVFGVGNVSAIPPQRPPTRLFSEADRELRKWGVMTSIPGPKACGFSDSLSQLDIPIHNAFPATHPKFPFRLPIFHSFLRLLDPMMTLKQLPTVSRGFADRRGALSTSILLSTSNTGSLSEKCVDQRVSVLDYSHASNRMSSGVPGPFGPIVYGGAFLFHRLGKMPCVQPCRVGSQPTCGRSRIPNSSRH